MLLTASSVLASIPAPPIRGIELGPVEIRLYAICIILGAVLAFWIGSRRWARRDGAEGAVFDIGMWAIVFGIVGARLYHVFVTEPHVFFAEGANPMRILYIWEGGIGIMGAILAGALGAFIACRRYGYKLSAFGDVVVPGILLAQAVGRWGNYFNQELFGAPTDLPWGLEVDPTHYNFPAGLPADTLFHPTFLYESLWNLTGVIVLLLIDRRFQLRRGMMLWSYVAWYTFGRIFMESLRLDEVAEYTVLGITLRLHAWFALVFFLIAIGTLIYLFVTRPRTEEGKAEADSVWLPGRKPETLESEDATTAAGSSAATAQGSSDVS